MAAAPVKWLGFSVVMATSLWTLWAMRQSGLILDRPDLTPERRSRAFRRLLRAVGAWEFSIAAFLLLNGGWAAIPSTIALVGTGLMVMFFPQIFDRTN